MIDMVLRADFETLFGAWMESAFTWRPSGSRGQRADMARAGTDPGYQHDREQLTLPEPASGLWNRIRATVHADGRRRPDERIEPRIGDGTTLARRWRHRASTDIEERTELEEGLVGQSK